MRFKQKFRPKCALKCVFFFNCKNRLSVPRLPPAAEGSASRPRRCCSRLLLQLCRVHFYSSAKCVLSPSKKNKITTVNVLFLLLPYFCT